jgi:hypothetical protein
MRIGAAHSVQRRVCSIIGSSPCQLAGTRAML